MFLAKNLTQFPPQSLPLLAGKLGGSCFLCVFEKLLDTRFQSSSAAAVLFLMCAKKITGLVQSSAKV